VKETEKLITIGKVTRPHGIKGEIKVEIITEDPDIFLELQEVMMVDERREEKNFIAGIKSVRFHQKAALLVLEEVGTMDDAEKLRGMILKVPLSFLPKPEVDEYYIFDLIGLVVKTTDGVLVGILKSVISGGGCDVFEIRHPETDKINLVPSRKEFVKSIDIKGKKMIIEPIEGLLDI
jgi:16S rRNA processing protein RimM